MALLKSPIQGIALPEVLLGELYCSLVLADSLFKSVQRVELISQVVIGNGCVFDSFGLVRLELSLCSLHSLLGAFQRAFVPT